MGGLLAGPQELLIFKEQSLVVALPIRYEADFGEQKVSELGGIATASVPGDRIFLRSSEAAMPAKRKPMNFKIIQTNLSEAVEELQGLERKAAKEELTVEAFQIGLLHAYLHLNTAWNVKYRTTEEYISLTDKQFKQWGKYPKGIERV